ncbi:hypothetical protein CK228_13600 [Mesorhizobium sp. WSM4312]|uniref:hypothetical protein n=1 Tax=Mesorhizobium sp. WSM4312 TaxID=2029411 RepID=UPI000BAF16BC|nr:hypothetical protein [Mesorhizobium sp. WSM4312]PBB68139.1 hypothetical protein CK228_13600 [Mesorhizobium sp. WSM4312]
MTGTIDVGASDLGRETQGAGFDGPALVSPTRNGLMSAADKVKLNGIEAGATGDQTPTEILTAIKTVDGAGSGLDADTLDGHDTSYFLPASSYTAADVLTKIKTVDGIGSGLDADLLDGLDSTAFVKADGSVAMTGTFTVQGTAPMIKFNDTDAGAHDYWVHANSNQFYVLVDRNDDGGWDVPHALQLDSVNNIGYCFGGKIWTASNDGAGSGLDADLLDGLNSEASAGTANTIAARNPSGDIFARLFRSEYTVANTTIAYLSGQNAIGAGATDNYIRPIAIGSVAAQLAASGAIYDRIELRGSQWGQYWVTNGTADAIAGMAVGAVGTYALLKRVPLVTSNPGDTTAGSNLQYANAGTVGASTSPAGTWRCMGRNGTGNDDNAVTIWLRIS